MSPPKIIGEISIADHCVHRLKPPPEGVNFQPPLTLWEARINAGLSRARLAARTQVAEETVWRIETGRRRTRRSTLLRAAEAMALPQHTLDRWVAATGPALAPESTWADRLDRRRAHRARRKES